MRTVTAVCGLVLSLGVLAMGVSLNRIVIYANGGKMPVGGNWFSYAPEIMDESHVRMTPETRLSILADIIRFPCAASPHDNCYYSIGDCLIFGGFCAGIISIAFPLFAFARAALHSLKPPW